MKLDPESIDAARNNEPRARILRDLTEEPDATPEGPEAEAPLPDPESAEGFLAREFPPRSILLAGFLRAGDKVSVGGASKSKKTFFVTDLAVSVASGTAFLGVKTEPVPVLYANLELHAESYQRRLRAVLKAREIRSRGLDLDVWNLRGHRASIERIAGKLDAISGTFGLLILDPMYKVLGTREENAAGDIADLLNVFDTLANRHRCAILYPGHFSKGNQAAKEHLDRISGSGVLARDPDCFVSMTRHETEGCLVVEATTRDFADPAPFVIEWDYPLFKRRDDLDPKDLKRPDPRFSPGKACTTEHVTSAVKAGNRKTRDIVRAVCHAAECSERAVHRRIADALASGTLEAVSRGAYCLGPKFTDTAR